MSEKQYNPDDNPDLYEALWIITNLIEQHCSKRKLEDETLAHFADFLSYNCQAMHFLVRFGWAEMLRDGPGRGVEVKLTPYWRDDPPTAEETKEIFVKVREGIYRTMMSPSLLDVLRKKPLDPNPPEEEA